MYIRMYTYITKEGWQVCPMLVRIFCKFEEHHPDKAFSGSEQPLDDEVRLNPAP